MVLEKCSRLSVPMTGFWVQLCQYGFVQSSRVLLMVMLPALFMSTSETLPAKPLFKEGDVRQTLRSPFEQV